MKPLFLLTFVLSSLFGLNAEPGSSVPDEEHMKAIASRVLNELKRAKGLLPHESPILAQVYTFRGAGKLASMYLDKGEIHLDARTYQICRSMGPDSLNALAFLLGHELGHFIHRHGGINHNIHDAAPGAMQSTTVVSVVRSAGADANFEIRMREALDEYEETYDEAEADFEGAFLGYLAGYETMEAGRTFLTRAYQNLNIDTSASGYPTLSERLAILQRTSRELEQLTPVFELSKYLVAIGQYADAIPLLEKVLEKFQSPEIYNNLGVIQVLYIQSLFPTPLTKYKFPLTLDATFRAPHPQFFNHVVSGGGHIGGKILIASPPCQLNLLQRRIETAEGYFERAIQQDEDYIIGYMNLSIAQSIKALLFDIKNGNVEMLFHVESPVCSQLKSEVYEKARSNIGVARQLCQEALTGHCIEYFSSSPSENLKLVSYPNAKNLRISRNPTIIPELPEEHFITMDSMGNTASFTIKSIYPSLLECFNRPSFAESTTIPNIAYLRWLTDDHKVPDNGKLLSNILSHIDLLYILDESRRSDSIEHAYPFKMQKKLPFQRALEIDPHNELAKFNRSVYTGQAPIRTMIRGREVCSSAESLNGQSIAEVATSIPTWDYQQEISQSRIMAFYRSREDILDNDENKLHRKSFKINQQIKYADKENYKIYENISKSENGVTEKSVFLIPKTPTNTACDVEVLSTRNNLKNKYDLPIREIETTIGPLSTYPLQSQRKVENREVSVDAWPPPDHERIDIVELTEDGIIFQINNSEQVENWVIYHTYSKSELMLQN